MATYHLEILLTIILNLVCQKRGRILRYNMDEDNSSGCVTNADLLLMKDAILIHGYSFGALFILLSATSMFLLTRILRNNRKMYFLITVECLVIVFGLMRALFLLIDPYRVYGLFPNLATQMLEDLAVPCLTSGFVLVQSAFWQLTKFQRMRAQRGRVFVVIIISHFLAISGLDLLISLAGTCILLLVCQGLTILWGLALSIGFLITVRNLHQIERKHRSTLRVAGNLNLRNVSRDGPGSSPGQLSPRTLEGAGDDVTHLGDGSLSIHTVSLDVEESQKQQISTPDSNLSGTTSDKPTHRSPQRMRSFGRINKPLRKVMVVGMATSGLGLVCFGLGVFGAIVYSNPYRPVENIMGWFIYQNMQRLVEFCFGVTLAYLTWQRNLRNR